MISSMTWAMMPLSMRWPSRDTTCEAISTHRSGSSPGDCPRCSKGAARGYKSRALASQSRGSGGRHYALVGASAVGVVRRSVGADLAVAGADEQARFDCLVALTEACTNALVHGHGEATPRVSWRIDGATARFCIE